MAYSPSSTVHCLSVPLDSNNKNQLTFADVAAQTSYFLSKIKQSFTDYTYIRKDNILRLALNVDALYASNYIMYQNAHFGDKWFYAFIIDTKYVNENCTEVTIKTDVFQTWYFEKTILQSFVVREHVSNDSIGVNLIEEGLETGEYKFKSMEFSQVLGNPVIIMAAAYGDLQIEGSLLSGVYNGLNYYVFSKSNSWALTEMLEIMDTENKGSAVVSIFMYPSGLLPSYVDGQPLTTGNTVMAEYAIDKNYNDIDGYAPKNNKLFCYPYNMLYVSNQTGGTAELRYEDFSTTQCRFSIDGPISPNPTIYCIPKYFKGTNFNFNEAVTLTGFPLCSWLYDVYKNWLAQNKEMLTLGYINTALGTVASVAGGNPVGGIVSGEMSILQQMAQVEQHKMQPPQARGNTSGGSSAFSIGILDFGFYPATIKAEYARKIDDYFEMFGYKVNEVKLPNITGRPFWNYVKTIDINITGDIPTKDMEELKSIFNNGVTLWHSGDNVGNYSLNNH
jgi:hypothetical protein